VVHDNLTGWIIFIFHVMLDEHTLQACACNRSVSTELVPTLPTSYKVVVICVTCGCDHTYCATRDSPQDGPELVSTCVSETFIASNLWNIRNDAHYMVHQTVEAQTRSPQVPNIALSIS